MGLSAFQRYRREQAEKAKANKPEEAKVETPENKEPEAPAFDINKATKDQIEAYVKEKHGIDLDKRMKAADMKAFAVGLDEGKTFEEIEAELAKAE